MATRVVILGGGTAGLEVARRLEQSQEAIEAVMVNPDGNHVYLPLLPEVAAGALEPRQAVLPLRSGLRRTTIVHGEVVGRSTTGRAVQVRRRGSSTIDLPYDHLVVTVGSINRVPPIPGLAEHAVGFQTLAEAVHLRDRVIDRIALAETCEDPQRRRELLTFVFVGGGYSGVEAAGELHDMAIRAISQFPGVQAYELHFVLVEATDSVLPMVGPKLQEATLESLRGRGVDVRLEDLVEAVDDDGVHLASGDVISADTLVWAAGVRPNPVLVDLGLPTDENEAVKVAPTLEVEGEQNVWAAGDCAAVPDLHQGGGATFPPAGQFALREGRHLADNIERRVRGEEPTDLWYRSKGEIITLGGGVAVGEVFNLPVRGQLAWAMRTAHHIFRIPTLRRKLRVFLDWSTNLMFRREITSLSSIRQPHAPFEAAAEHD